MLKFYQFLSRVLRRVADWLDAHPMPNQELIDFATELIEKAEGFAPGTSGEFKRQWVITRLKKRFPAIPTYVLALGVEQAFSIFKVK